MPLNLMSFHPLPFHRPINHRLTNIYIVINSAKIF